MSPRKMSRALASSACSVAALVGARRHHRKRSEPIFAQAVARYAPPTSTAGLTSEGSAYIGRVSRFDHKSGYGFIECSRTLKMYSRDVFLHKDQARDIRVGDHVRFTVQLNQKGQPQARDVTLVLVEKELEYFVDYHMLNPTEMQQRLAGILAELGDPAFRKHLVPTPEEPKTDQEQVEKQTGMHTEVGATVIDESVEENKLRREHAAGTDERDTKDQALQEIEDAWAAVERLQGGGAHLEVPSVAGDGASASDAVKQPDDETAEKEEEDKKEVPPSQYIDSYVLRAANITREKIEALEAELAGSDMGSGMQEKSEQLFKLLPVMTLYDELLKAVKTLKETEELVESEDEELALIAQEELPSCRARLEDLRMKVEDAFVPAEPADAARTVLLEIHGGIGGEEANVWVEELIRMYTKYCESEGMTVEVLDTVKKYGLGLQHATLEVKGHQVVPKLKLEHGVHRSQRMTTSSVQTCTACVSVKPQVLATGKGQHGHIAAHSSEDSGGGRDIRGFKVRTYQFRERRVTDHRSNLNFPLDKVLNGGLHEIVASLQVRDRRARLERFVNEAEAAAR